MEPMEDLDLPVRIEMSTEAALMEGMRIVDEVSRAELPPMRATVSVATPLNARLRDLQPEQLDVFQVVLRSQSLESIFNNCALDDIELAEAIKGLIKAGYLEVTET